MERPTHLGIVRLACPMVFLAMAASCGEDPSKPASEPPPGFSYPLASYREACRITAVGAREAMRSARPAQTEGDVKRIIDAAFQAEGCLELAFPHIVAAGANALSLHYEGGDSALAEGDLLLIDIGAASGGICSDCTRTFPVSAAFSPRQRELYQLVLDVQQQVVQSARPGVDALLTLDDRATELFRASPLRARDDDGELYPMNHFIQHSLGHYVGKQVHGEDTGWSPVDPLRAGQVLAIEPGIYVPAEGIGIRIEDTYLVTESGLECLTCGSPKEPAAMESLRSSLTMSAAVAVAAGPLPVGAGAFDGPHLRNPPAHSLRRTHR